MDRKIKLYNDIVNGINLIEDFIGPINLFEEYTVDYKTKSAIERQLGIVGEAIKRIREFDPETRIPFQHEIIGFRNILVHNYDNIDDSIVWSIIKHDLILLKKDILARLEIE